jgi:Domain of unknown function (DUF4271)
LSTTSESVLLYFSIIFKILTTTGFYFNIFAAQFLLRVKQFLFTVFFLLFFNCVNYAQSPVDTTPQLQTDTQLVKDPVVSKDSLPVQVKQDSVSKRPVIDSVRKASILFPVSNNQLEREILQHHPYFGFTSVIIPRPKSELKIFEGKELLFYMFVFLLFVFAFLKQLFPKYFSDLFRLFFRTTIKQKQVREQLMQTPLPSLMLNGFFVVSVALYISFLVQHYKADSTDNFWLMFFYALVGLSAAYFVKFVGLKISGWLFSMQEAADSYIFIVFIVNKMIGILLLPLLIILAFSPGNVYMAGLTLSWCLLGGLLLYRFILTWSAVRNQIKVNIFHFFLYLLAFEIAPLLLVYKGLLLFFGQTA